MKITNLNILKNEVVKNDLDDIVMEHLHQVVLVVGKNGAGKTRLLEKVKNAVEQQILPSEKNKLEQKISEYEEQISKWNLEISRYQDPNYNKHIVDQKRTDQIENFKTNCIQFKGQIDQWKKQLGTSFITYVGDLTLRNVLHFVPKGLKLVDPRNLKKVEVENYAKNLISSNNINNLHDWSLSRIQDLSTQYWNATHPTSKTPTEKKNEIIRSYTELQKLSKELLGVEFGNDEQNNATLFNFPIGDSKLSDGQKVLLQLVVAIHAHGLKLSETILLLDEPENHLHPAAIIEVIEKLKHSIPHGQIWIATHSISILAHFSEEASIYYLEGGKTSKAGSGKTNVLQSLLGDEERVRRQAEFLEEPVTHAMNVYSAQCLLPPEVVITEATDPQMKQIRNALFDIPSKKIKVLDFGAGKGRLITNLIETTADIDNLRKSLDYVALDCDLGNRLECEKQINRIYNNNSHCWFQKYQDLLVHHNKGGFDVIVMTNVLHEINPKDWLNYFGPSGQLTELLKDNGQLLLVEDQRIPVGEAAHEFGFIVIDTGALKDLCKISGNDKQIIIASERDGRLKAHLIPKTSLMKVDKNSIQKALETHSQHSKNEIEILRSQKDKSKSRSFAFWMHQYANTKLALEGMKH